MKTNVGKLALCTLLSFFSLSMSGNIIQSQSVDMTQRNSQSLIPEEPSSTSLPEDGNTLRDRTVLFVYGGWEGHDPKGCRDVFVPWLSGEGAKVIESDKLSIYKDRELMSRVDLIVQVWTMGSLQPDEEAGLLSAVRNGAGIAGWHGGLGDSFRNNTEYQFMVGGQWVAHPGNIVDYDVSVKDRRDPVMQGIKTFHMKSEQYYMHVDPAVNVLATTRILGKGAPWIEGVEMPAVWKKVYGQGRVFYSSLGHVASDFDVPEALEIMKRGIRWAVRHPQNKQSDTGMTSVRDVVFAHAPTKDNGTKDLKINIWKGKGEGPQPVVLFMHGGAWVSGDNNLEPAGSEQIKALMSLRERGITIAAATYRFSNEAIFPAQIHDVKAAIRYLKANAGNYGIDPSRIMTMGESAGAQLALLAAVSNGEEAMEGNIGGNLEVDSKVIGCVDCYGMTDFLTLASDLYARKDLGRTDAQVYELVEDKNSSRSQLFGLTTDECNLGTVTAAPHMFPAQYALARQGSPLHHVTPDDPPILIINGQKDIRVPSAQAIKLYEALYSAGVETELLLNDRAPHGNLGPESAAAIKSFITRILLR